MWHVICMNCSSNLHHFCVIFSVFYDFKTYTINNTGKTKCEKQLNFLPRASKINKLIFFFRQFYPHLYEILYKTDFTWILGDTNKFYDFEQITFKILEIWKNHLLKI